MRHALAALGLVLAAPGLPPGYWGLDKAGPVLEKTQTLRLAPDLTRLTPGERTAVAKLLEVGGILQRVYEESRHREAISSLRALEALDRARDGSPETKALLDLQRLNQGPIATTLENGPWFRRWRSRRA